jgi:hypothetical protein
MARFHFPMTPRAEKIASPDFFWPLVVRVHRTANLVCALCVGLGGVAWWTWSEAGRPRRVDLKPVAPRMVWLADRPADVAEAWRSDVRAISSPVLFALPTPLGFSRGALRDSAFGEPFEPAVSVPVSRQGFAAPTSLVARIARATPAEAAVAARALAWPQNGGFSHFNTTGPTSPVIVVVWRSEGSPMQRHIVPITTNSVWADEQAWEAVARIDLDDHGWADRVLLEKATASSNRNALIVQLLRTLNFGSTGAREGRVAVRFEGNGARPVLSAKESAP